MSNNILKILVFLILFGTASRISAEAFGNNSLAVPKMGLAFFDTPLLPHKKPWGLDLQWIVGTSFMQAINYRWWWIAETSFNFGHLNMGHAPYLGAFSGGAGVRFNIFEEDFRPHIGMMVHYLHFLGEGTSSMPLNLGWPIFVGLRPYIGLEWLFYSEMGLILEGGYGLYLNINEPFRQVLHTTLAFALYF